MIDSLVQFADSLGIIAFMNSTWGWPIVESLHFIGLSLIIGTVGLFDLRMLGLAPALSLAQLHRLVPLGVGGYLLNVLTGTMFVSAAPDQYLYNPAFQTKLLFMLGAGLNMVAFYLTTGRSVRLLAAGAPEPPLNRLFATVSLLCWCGVIVGGRLITYYRPPYHWCLWC